MVPLAALAEDKFEPPTQQKQVDPVYPADLKAFVIEPTKVEMVIDQDGVPFSLKSVGGLPDVVVQAMSKWRYRPAKKNGTAVGYRLSVPMLVREPFDSIERTRSYNLTHGKEMVDAIAAAKDLDAEAAAQMEQRLTPLADDVSAHLTLLVFAQAGADDAIRQIRLRQILWFSTRHPEHGILATPYVTLSEPSPEEANIIAEIRRVWQAALALHPEDPVLLDHATNVLRLTDSAMMERAIVPVLEKTDHAALFLGDLYGLAALGATAADPETGSISAVSKTVADSPFAVQTRAALDKTTDLRILLPALSTISRAGRPLAKAGHVPEGYMEFCTKLLARVRDAYPDVDDRCVTEPATNVRVEAAKLIKPELPVYPQYAKDRRITGVVTLRATIGRDGRPKNIELLSGALALYGAAREAVMKWRYQPTQWDGVAIEVTTTIDVNFNLAN